MEIERQQELVEAFHYATITSEIKNEDRKTELNIGMSPIEPTEDESGENSILAVRLDFQLVFDECILSGAISQINHIINRKIKAQEDVTSSEVDQLAAPLFDIVKRLVYEVTEIALDKPGMQLNFQYSDESK
ncbi:DUF1149 family protein [Melissococcus plutonius]|uniref:DUF1149 family protein n=1 Tax=Melissococcus plutonius TaxID=33970 RepID=UPI003C2FA4F0